MNTILFIILLTVSNISGRAYEMQNRRLAKQGLPLIVQEQVLPESGITKAIVFTSEADLNDFMAKNKVQGIVIDVKKGEQKKIKQTKVKTKKMIEIDEITYDTILEE